jgi:hypothetical protein
LVQDQNCHAEGPDIKIYRSGGDNITNSDDGYTRNNDDDDDDSISKRTRDRKYVECQQRQRL